MKQDDAAEGLRGLRARPSPELVEAICERYGLSSVTGVADLGGSSSLNLHVQDGNRRYVVRVYRPYVTEARLNDINRVRRQLSNHGLPCSNTIHTKDGQRWITFDARLVEVERYIHHDAYMDSWHRLEAALPMLGRIHTILQDVEVSPDGRGPLFANHIEPQDVLSKTLRGARRIRGWGASSADLQLADAAEELAQRVAAEESGIVSELPRQLVHGDFWDNNVFMRGDDVALITDFDFMGERARIDDLALTLFFVCLKYAENPVSHEQILRLRKLVDAYNSGLDEPLSGAERAALAPALARQPLWSIGGWVALLDDERTARQHASETTWEVDWALQVAREFARWRTAFTQVANTASHRVRRWTS